MNPTRPHDSSGSKALKAVVVLQALTLVAVLAGRPTASTAEAFEPNRGRNAPTLPNAAAQRQEMIRLLSDVVEASKASSEASAKELKAIDKRLEGMAATIERIEDRLPEPQGQPAQRPQQQGVRR